MATMRAEIVHVTIERTPEDVYDFASRPETMPLWASGLAAGFERQGDVWIATGELGRARVTFAPLNALGVIDHSVTLESGISVYNALRVTPNGDGAEVAFTVLQLPDSDDTAFSRDVAWVRKDLLTLKHILETGPSPPEA